MPAVSGSAPAKIILFGEHAVVYGNPAIAIPISHLRTRVSIQANPVGKSGSIHIDAPDVDLHTDFDSLQDDHPLKFTIRIIQSTLNINHIPACRMKITSDIPIASGMGSGTALSVSMARAISSFVGREIDQTETSQAAFEVEKIHHGTPSGIDNTVITWESPVFFVPGKTLQRFTIPDDFIFISAYSGESSHTAAVVKEIRELKDKKPELFNQTMKKIGEITNLAYENLKECKIEIIGELMNRNHTLLQQLGISNNTLDQLVNTARNAGAFGAKLSGAGKGGNIVALGNKENQNNIIGALKEKGAVLVTACNYP